MMRPSLVPKQREARTLVAAVMLALWQTDRCCGWSASFLMEARLGMLTFSSLRDSSILAARVSFCFILKMNLSCSISLGGVLSQAATEHSYRPFTFCM